MNDSSDTELAHQDNETRLPREVETAAMEDIRSGYGETRPY